MSLTDQFKQHLHNNFGGVIRTNSKWLLAVSGGVDSVLLCHLVHKAGIDFAIAHCNFQLRGSESQRDEDFVKALGNAYGKQVFVQQFNAQAFALQHKQSIQVAARNLRYQWFYEIINGQWQMVNGVGQPVNPENSLVDGSEGTRPQLIVTAHHANDNIETLLMNFFKGTGIGGLHGILPLTNQLFRPLLPFKKEELLAYAQQQGLQYVQDSSNQSDKYTRNYLRQHVMPALKTLYPQIEDNLLHNIERFGEVEQLYRQAVDLHVKKLLEYKGQEVHMPALKLLKMEAHRTILYEVIKQYGFVAAQLDDAVALLQSDSGRYIVSASHRLLKNRQWLIITLLETTTAANIIIDEGDLQVAFEGGSIHISINTFDNNKAIPEAKTVAWIDAGLITFPMLLRKWKKGDYFYPLGMRKKKKLSRFFIDQKLSLADKEKVWVMEMDKKIVWVVGQRIDDRFKVGPATTNVVEIVCSK